MNESCPESSATSWRPPANTSADSANRAGLHDDSLIASTPGTSARRLSTSSSNVTPSPVGAW